MSDRYLRIGAVHGVGSPGSNPHAVTGAGTRLGLTLTRDPHRQFADPVNEGREHALGLADDLDSWQPIEDFLPKNLQLHFGQALADAAVNTEAERQMLAWTGAVDDEAVGVFDRLLVAVARDVPHGDFVALADELAAKYDVFERGAAHVGDRRLVTNGLRRHRVDQFGPGAQLGEFIRVLAQEQEAAAHRIARRVVAADHEQADVAERFARAHVARGLAMRQHGNEIAARLGMDPLVPQIHEIAEAFAED